MSSNRLIILRQYLLDIRDYSGGLIEAADAINYVRWNFFQAVKSTLQKHDQDRGIQRQIVTKFDIEEQGLSTKEDFQINQINMVELHVHNMDKIIKTPESFAFWFHKNIMSPILAEEDRVLKYSSTKKIQVFGSVKAHFDRIAEMMRFKIWEVVRFPDAKDVPSRIEPVPEEKS